jgi:C4-dicarboxylate transporter DctM subunit
MEMGLIHPPVGLNIFVINKIAPDIGLKDIVLGTLPFVFMMTAAIVLLCIFPQIATFAPDLVYNK